MKKSDLKDGMVVETRDGIKYLIRTLENGDKILSAMGKWLALDDGYDEDLTDDTFKDLDIVKIFTTNEFVLSSVFNENSLNLIWERKREIDWSKVPKWTKVQVRDVDNERWINEYFLCTAHNNRFLVTSNDEFTFNGIGQTWKQCRIHPDVEIQEDWYKEDDGAVG